MCCFPAWGIMGSRVMRTRTPVIRSTTSVSVWGNPSRKWISGWFYMPAYVHLCLNMHISWERTLSHRIWNIQIKTQTRCLQMWFVMSAEHFDCSHVTMSVLQNMTLWWKLQADGDVEWLLKEWLKQCWVALTMKVKLCISSAANTNSGDNSVFVAFNTSFWWYKENSA